MRIVAGTLRGRTIPFTPKRHGHVRVTSAKLKEAVFAILGASLEGETFLDLCAGSGQIALEAHSRGARVLANEPDGRREACLRHLVRQWQLTDFELHGAKAQVLIPQLAAQGRSFDIVYADPPYEATHADLPLSEALLRLAAEAGLLAPGGLLLVQHSRRLDLPERCGNLLRQRRRTYGDTDLSHYAAA
ncbi:MAG: RsmD family RNA methyltransferase [Gemmatimonadota bacterium]